MSQVLREYQLAMASAGSCSKRNQQLDGKKQIKAFSPVISFAGPKKQEHEFVSYVLRIVTENPGKPKTPPETPASPVASQTHPQDLSREVFLLFMFHCSACE